MHIHPLIELHFYRPMLRCRRVPHPYHCRDVVSRSNNISDAARDLCDCAHHGEERRVEDGERAMQPHGKSLQRCTLTFVVWCSCRGCGAVLRLVRTRLEEAATAHCSLATNLLTPVRVCKAVVSCVLIFFGSVLLTRLQCWRWQWLVSRAAMHDRPCIQRRCQCSARKLPSHRARVSRHRPPPPPPSYRLRKRRRFVFREAAAVLIAVVVAVLKAALLVDAVHLIGLGCMQMPSLRMIKRR